MIYVLIPIYNRIHKIIIYLNSIYGQGLSDIRVVVVDDTS